MNQWIIQHVNNVTLQWHDWDILPPRTLKSHAETALKRHETTHPEDQFRLHYGTPTTGVPTQPPLFTL